MAELASPEPPGSAERAGPSAIAQPGRAAPRAGGGYSRFVGLMRISLPLVAAAIIGMVIAWPEFSEQREGFRLGVSKATLHDTGGQQMVSPRFTGTDRNQRPYTVTADAAEQSPTAANVIDLAFPKADLVLQNGSWIAVSAANGRFNRRVEDLTLRGGVDLFHDRGYELHTTTARIDLKQGAASGDEPVHGQGPIGRLEGKGFRIWDKGRRMLLTGKSRILLYPAARVGGR